MDTDKADNPIVLRLKTLGEMWNVSMQHKAAALTVWRVPPDQDRMVDAFVYLEDSEQGVTPSIFFTFESDFIDHETYAFELIKEFLTQAGRPESRASIERSGAKIEELTIGEIKDTRAWLKLLADFSGMIDVLEGHFVAYLLPGEVSSQEGWLKWLEKLLELELPNKIKVMVKEDARASTFSDLLEDYPDKTNLLEPKLDMFAAYGEILAEANKGKENEPGAVYQKLCLQLNEAVAQKNMGLANKIASDAIAITQAEEWPNLEVAIYFILANGYLGQRDLEAAKQQYEKSRATSIVFAEQNPAIGHQLEIQSIMGIAGITLGEQDFTGAAELYASSAPIATKIDKPILVLEAWRMSGFCYQQDGAIPQAWEQYQLAWEAGKTLDTSVRLSTTMPYVAKSLLEIREKSRSNMKLYELEDEIAAGLGTEWVSILAALD